MLAAVREVSLDLDDRFDSEDRTGDGGGGGGVYRGGGGGGGSSSTTGNTNTNNTNTNTGNTNTSTPTSGKTSSLQNLSFLDILDKKLSLVLGTTRELKINIVTSKSSSPSTIFTSSNPSVATITRTGTYTAYLVTKSAGSATIKVNFTDADGSYYEDSISLTVLPSGTLENISEDKKIWMVIGGKKELSISGVVSINSSDTSIVTTKIVSGKGKLTAWAAGICTVNVETASSSESYYVIVTHGDKTNYLDVVTFEKSTSWEKLNLGSVFIVGCSEAETSGYQGIMFKSNILNPQSWRDLVNRSYKELKVSKLGQDINITVTPPTYLEDDDSEEAWVSKWGWTSEDEDVEIACNFVGTGVYRFGVQSNCPVRFRTSSDKISIGPWSGVQKLEYVLSDFGNNKSLPIHVLDLPTDSVETIDITYESLDGRISETLKVNLYPPLPGLINIRGPYIYVIPGESSSYNQRIELRSFGPGLTYSGIEYPKDRSVNFDGTNVEWVSNLGAADSSLVSLRVSTSSKVIEEKRSDEYGASKYYLTLKSVTGYTVGEIPTAPVARLKFEVTNSTEHTFEPVNIEVRDYIYYYIYVLPAIPSKNVDTYEPLIECPTSYKDVSFSHSIFEGLRADNIDVTWPGTDVRFVDASGMSQNFSIRFPENYSRYVARNNFGVSFQILWTGTSYTWNQTAYGGEVGTLVIKWYYNKNYILMSTGLIKNYIQDGSSGYTTFGEPPYSPNDQFYTQTIHFVKFGKTDHILNRSLLPTYYSALGTYDPVTLNPGYEVIKTDLGINQNFPVGGGFWKYIYREEEVSGIPIKYTCEQSKETIQNLNLTVEPRGNNVSFSLSEWEELEAYNLPARGEIKFICESNVNHHKSSTVLDTYSFMQAGLEDCMLFRDKFYLGRSEINLPDISYASTDLTFGNFGIRSYKISDICNESGQISKVREIDNGINVRVWREGQETPFLETTVTTFNNLSIPENNEETDILYTIEVSHSESLSFVSSGSSSFESKLIIKVKQRTKSSDVYINKDTLPFIWSYGSLSSPIILYTSIPRNKIVIEEVLYQDSTGRWVVGDGIIDKPRIVSFTQEEVSDQNIPSGYKCFRCFLTFTPNSSFATIEGSTSYLGEDTIRRIRVRHLDIDEGSIYELKQGYYTIYPTLMYKKSEDESQDLVLITEKDCRDIEQPSHLITYNMLGGYWQVGTQYNPVNLPPFRNAGSNRDMNKVWVSLMALRHEVCEPEVSWVNTTKLFEEGGLEIEKNSRKLFPDTIEKSDTVLSESDWFSNIQTDLVIHSTDKTSERTWEVLKNIPEEDDGKEDIEFPALETIYTASKSGFYERRVVIQENIELKLGVLGRDGNILQNGTKPCTVNSKIQIWYRKIGEDIKDE